MPAAVAWHLSALDTGWSSAVILEKVAQYDMENMMRQNDYR